VRPSPGLGWARLRNVAFGGRVVSASGVPVSDAERRTVYALSTPPGKAGVAVFRVSGPAAEEAWRRMVRVRRGRGRGRAAADAPRPWRFERCAVVDPDSGDVLDEGLAVFFKGAPTDVFFFITYLQKKLILRTGPKSFTTEDVLELHTHSGRALVAAILAALARLPFCRPAEPGEFTRRAFEGGRLDLTQVEGLKDLIDSETETQRRLALRVAGVRECTFPPFTPPH
jgi:tRNA modification GTPase